MNYYPYYNGIPFNFYTPINNGGHRSLFSGIKWSSILNGTQKTLGIVNQAIPIIKQAGSVINNAKTMFKVMNEFKKVDVPIQNNVTNTSTSEKVKENLPKTQMNGPTFFQ